MQNSVKTIKQTNNTTTLLFDNYEDCLENMNFQNYPWGGVAVLWQNTIFVIVIKDIYKQAEKIPYLIKFFLIIQVGAEKFLT